MAATTSARGEPSFAEVRTTAAQHAESVCRRLLPGGRRKGIRWRCGDTTGAPGESLGVVLEGDAAGTWKDHATGDSGDLIALVQVQHALSAQEAKRELARMLGMML